MRGLSKSERLLGRMKDGIELSGMQRFQMVFYLSIPAIMAQITSVVMQYIDASMVGSLGASASASIGLMSSSTWLFSGICGSAASGFSIQAAHCIGAGKTEEARSIMRQAVMAGICVSLLLAAVGSLIAAPLPAWLGAAQEIRRDASRYFMIFALSLPALQLNRVAGGLLQCSGNMKVPGMLNILMCILDVVFNWFFIFPTRIVHMAGASFRCPGAGLGVMGAAFGTAMAELVTAVLMMGFLCFRSGIFRLKRTDRWRFEKKNIGRALRLAAPIAWENMMMCGAMVATTRVVAPLGTVSIAANSFAITAESLCYMPGYGIGDAAMTLVGQSTGAGRRELTRKFARMSAWLGMSVMAATGAVMYLCAPGMMAILTPDLEVQMLGVRVLRLEAFAEPMYAASIVASGALRGAGDTFIPSMMNFASIWVVRLPLAILLAGRMGLMGVWIAMCIELCFRGAIFLIRLYRERWMK